MNGKEVFDKADLVIEKNRIKRIGKSGSVDSSGSQGFQHGRKTYSARLY